MKNSVTLLGCLMALGMAIWPLSASAAIIYVDATDTNTVMASLPDGPVGAGVPWVTNSSDAADGIWRLRTGFGLEPTVTSLPSGVGSIPNNATSTVFESASAAIDNDPRLKTSVSGLPSDNYDVYVYFWTDQNGSPWGIRAGLDDLADANTLSWFTKYTGTTTVVASDTANSDGRELLQVYLGQVTSTTSIDVFVEDFPATDGNSRTWYDGIGYERAIPEPASIALMLVGLAIPVFSRRRD